MATIMPINTNTTIATCIQIQVGDILRSAYDMASASTAALGLRYAWIMGHALPWTARLCARLLVAVAGLALLMALPAGVVDARTTRPARPALAVPLAGVNVGALGRSSSPAAADRTIRLAQALHARVVRFEIPWSVLEPRGPGALDPHALAFLDRLTSDAGAAGIGVIATVASTPCWASSAPASLLHRCSPTHFSHANAWPPSNPGDYATFVAYLAHRYGTWLAALEVWNEPDQANESYFAGPNKARNYAALLRAAYPAIKQANAQVQVLAGSIVGPNGKFLRALYAAGIRGNYDGLAVHFYTLTLAALRFTHKVQLASGDTRPMWLDEFGWSSCWPRYRVQQEQPCVTRQIQARNLQDTLRSLASTPYVAAEVVYDLQGSVREDFGALSETGAHKPAFSALARVFASPFGRVSPVTLSLRRRGRRVRASGSAPVGDFVALEAFRGSVLRYRAVFTLDRFDRYAVMLPAVLGTHGLRVRVYRYWEGPSGGARKNV
jgi:hypothetical protein